jgi:hypothetical protein
MPKSAKDDLIARINDDLARLDTIERYVKTGDDVLGRIAADRQSLQNTYDYVTAQGPKAAPVEKTKRTRGKGKRGLPDAAKPDAADLTF